MPVHQKPAIESKNTHSQVINITMPPFFFCCGCVSVWVCVAKTTPWARRKYHLLYPKRRKFHSHVNRGTRRRNPDQKVKVHSSIKICSTTSSSSFFPHLFAPLLRGLGVVFLQNKQAIRSPPKCCYVFGLTLLLFIAIIVLGCVYTHKHTHTHTNASRQTQNELSDSETLKSTYSV